MEGKWTISTEGGNSPLWSPDGSELYYRDGKGVMAVSVETDAAFSPGIPRRLFEGDFVTGTIGVSSYDLAPGGDRFLMMKAVEDEDDEEEPGPNFTEIVVVLNWMDQLERLAPVPEGN